MRTKSTALRPRPVYDFSYIYYKKNELCCEVYMNDSPSQEKIRLHHLPIGEVGPRIKCSHLSLSRCGMGSLGTCTHIILRPKTYSLFTSIAETSFHYLLVTLGKYCKGLQTAHPRWPACQPMCWQFCNKWKTVPMGIMMK